MLSVRPDSRCFRKLIMLLTIQLGCAVAKPRPFSQLSRSRLNLESQHARAYFEYALLHPQVFTRLVRSVKHSLSLGVGEGSVVHSTDYNPLVDESTKKGMIESDSAGGNLNFVRFIAFSN